MANDAKLAEKPEREPEKRDDPTLRAMDSMRSIVRAIGASTRTLGKTGGVSGAQLFALRQIAASPGMHLGELATRTMARQSSVSELVARLADRGLVTRTPGDDDARQVNLNLTASGRRAISESRATAQERLISGLGILSRSSRAALADGLEAWLAASGLADVPPTMFFEHAEQGGKAARKKTARRRGKGAP
jgi:MarR family transcriptional regulator, organic hydroperoxide resistance regulator